MIIKAIIASIHGPFITGIVKQLVEKKCPTLLFLWNYRRNSRSALETHPIQAIFVNRDYTPFSQEREKRLQNIVKRKE